MPRHPLSRTSIVDERSSSAEGSVNQSQPKKSRKNECAARIHFTQIEPKVFRSNICGVTIEQTGRTTEDTKEELVRFICQSASPWNIVSKKYFIRLLRFVAQNEISLPSTRAVKAKAFNLYAELKTSICDRLESVDRLAITLDCWTSDNQISFIGLTVHWVDTMENVRMCSWYTPVGGITHWGVLERCCVGGSCRI